MEKLETELDYWLRTFKKTSVKPSTYDRLLVSFTLLKRYPIAGISADKLKVEDIQSYVNRLVEDGYALTTIKKQFHLISDFIDHCLVSGKLTKPVHKGVHMPSESLVKKHKRAIFAYDKDEQAALLKVLLYDHNPAYKAVILMLETGIRVGEALALEWDDVDWKRKALRISKTVVRLAEGNHSYIQHSAKSFASNRTIPLSPRAYEMLDDLHKIEEAKTGFIFHDKKGRRLKYESLRWHIKKACSEANINYRGQHVFRHTFATNCYEKGCDIKLLSKFLGHSDVSTTYNIYIHLFGDALEQMRQIIT